jgi:hypothetical protein
MTEYTSKRLKETEMMQCGAHGFAILANAGADHLDLKSHRDGRRQVRKYRGPQASLLSIFLVCCSAQLG